MKKLDKILTGYDNNGMVFDLGDSIHRIIEPSYFCYAEEVFEIFDNKFLSNIGIVPTRLVKSTKSFTHDKFVISYPYEWPAEMYKDAVLFHINLFLELDKFSLTFKDALPSNILFNFSHPVFVDFLSIIKTINIDKEKWLVDGYKLNEKRFAVVEEMLVPYMIIPFLLMEDKNYSEARSLLANKACNMGNEKPGFQDAYKAGKHDVFENIKHPRAFLKKLQKLKKAKKYLLVDQATDFKDFLNRLYSFIEKSDVTPSAGSYVDYYQKKQESFDFSPHHSWELKQRNIFSILENEKPESVLDVGANTGWFSFLAESLGAKVISLDIEEDCVNEIYHLAKKGNKNILPLLVAFDDLTKSYFGIEIFEGNYEGRDYKNTPLFLLPIERFHSDLVLCLGLIHHLILGSGYNISQVLEILSQMAKKCLLIEFVSIKDPLVVAEPLFFKSLNQFDSTNYNLDILVSEGKKFFDTVEIFPSHPESRTLVKFSR